MLSRGGQGRGRGPLAAGFGRVAASLVSGPG